MCCAIDSILFTHAFEPGSTANEREQGRARLAAHLAVEAAEAELSTTAKAVGILVNATVNAAQGAAKRDVLFVDSVVPHGFK